MNNGTYEKLEGKLTEMFLENQRISMFKDIVPVLFSHLRNEPMGERLIEVIRSAIRSAIVECKCRGKEFVVCPEFALRTTENTILSITDFVYEEVCSGISDVSVNVSYKKIGEGKVCQAEKKS